MTILKIIWLVFMGMMGFFIIIADSGNKELSETIGRTLFGLLITVPAILWLITLL